MFLTALNQIDPRGLLLIASGLTLGGLLTGIVYSFRRRSWLRRQRAAFEVKVAPLREALAARERRVGEVEQQLGETVQRCQWLEHRDNAAAGQVVELQEILDRERKANLGFKELLQIAETRLAEVFNNLAVGTLNRTNAAFFNLAKGEIDKYERVALQELQKRQGAMEDLVNPLQLSLAGFEAKIAQLEDLRQQLATPPPAEPEVVEETPEEPPALPAHEATSSTEFGIAKLADDAREISDMGQKMHDQLIDIRSHIAYLGKFLDGARVLYRETVDPAGDEQMNEPEEAQAPPPEPVQTEDSPERNEQSEPVETVPDQSKTPPEPEPVPEPQSEVAPEPEPVPEPQSDPEPEPVPEPEPAKNADEPAPIAETKKKTRQPAKSARPAARIAKKATRKKRPAARRKKPVKAVKPVARSRAKVEEDDAEEDRDGLVLDFDRQTGIQSNGSHSSARFPGVVEAD